MTSQTYPTNHKDLDTGTEYNFWNQVRELMSNPETMRGLIQSLDQSEITCLAIGSMTDSVTDHHFSEGLYLALVDAVNDYLTFGSLAA